jgi:hypothetical protein
MATALDPPEREAQIKAKRREFERLCHQVGMASMTIRSIASCILWAPGPASVSS